MRANGRVARQNLVGLFMGWVFGGWRRPGGGEGEPEGQAWLVCCLSFKYSFAVPVEKGALVSRCCRSQNSLPRLRLGGGQSFSCSGKCPGGEAVRWRGSNPHLQVYTPWTCESLAE